MFKALSIFKHKNLIEAFGRDDLAVIGFNPCGPTDQKSIGFVPPRGEGEALFEEHDGGTLLAVMIETKSVPASAVQRGLEEAVKSIEQATGRKPGKKEKRGLKEEIVLSLLPVAFPKQTKVHVWVDKSGLLLIDNTSAPKVDDVITLLIRGMPDGVVIEELNTAESAGTLMTRMLLDDDLSDLVVGKELLLEACDESAAKVKYTNHALHIEEIRAHIAQGKRPASLALSNDSLSFTLTDSLQLKKIQVDDEVVLASKDRGTDFDASLFIVTRAIVDTVNVLIEELGGEAAKERANV